MSYQIHETRPAPSVDSLRLEVDGEVVAIAKPIPSYSAIGSWRLEFGDGLVAASPDEDHARDLLAWLGERLSPLDVINGPEDLHRAPIGSLWQSDYPANQSGGTVRNRYRLTTDGWDWLDDNIWVSCRAANNGGPYKAAYPLRLVSE